MLLTEVVLGIVTFLRLLFLMIGLVLFLLIFIGLCWWLVWRLILSHLPFIQEMLGRPASTQRASQRRTVTGTNDQVDILDQDDAEEVHPLAEPDKVKAHRGSSTSSAGHMD